MAVIGKKNVRMTTWEMSIVTSTWMTFKHEKEGKDIMTLLDLCKVYFGSHDMMKYEMRGFVLLGCMKKSESRGVVLSCGGKNTAATVGSEIETYGLHSNLHHGIILIYVNKCVVVEHRKKLLHYRTLMNSINRHETTHQ